MNRDDLVDELKKRRWWFASCIECALSGKCTMPDQHQETLRKIGERIKQLEDELKEME